VNAMEHRCVHNGQQLEKLMQESASNITEHQSFRRRLDELEENGRRQNDILLMLQRQADAIEAMGEKIENLAGGVNRVAGKVAQLESEPALQWKKMGFEIVKYIVLAAIGAAIGFKLK